MNDQVTVTFTADVSAVTDALLAIESWDERVYGGAPDRLPDHNALGPIVLAMRAARDEAIASG